MDYKTVVMPERLTAENGAKSLLSGEFYEAIRVGCPECIDIGDIDDNCPLCHGEGTIKTKVAVSWTTIKEIYKAAVDHFTGQSQGPL